MSKAVYLLYSRCYDKQTGEIAIDPDTGFYAPKVLHMATLDTNLVNKIMEERCKMRDYTISSINGEAYCTRGEDKTRGDKYKWLWNVEEVELAEGK